MRVPVPEGATAQSAQLYQQTSPTQVQPDASVGNALEGAGRVAMAAGESYDREQRRLLEAAKAAQAKAQALLEAQAQTDFERGATGELYGDSEQGKAGFLSTVGTAASAASSKTTKNLEAIRDSIADSLPNEAARQAFIAKSGGMLEGYRRQVESHTAQQFQVAQSATARAREETALTAIANNYAAPEEVAKHEVLAEQSIRALAVSPEDAAAKVQEFQAKAVKVRLGQYLGAHDVAGAEALFAQKREVLGVDAPQFAKVIAAAKQDALGETTAQRLFDSAVDAKTGWVDASKALVELDRLPAGAVKDEARGRLEHRLSLAERQKKQAIEERFNNALSAYQKAGTLAAVSPADRVFLQSPENDPTQWEKLRAIVRADTEHAKNAPASPSQQRALAEFLVDVADNPDKYATMPVATFNSEWAPRLGKTDRVHAASVLAAAHGKATKPENLSPLVTKQLLQTGRDAGVFDGKQNDVSKWGDDQAELYYRSVQTLQDAVTAYRKQNGKEPPLEQVQKWTAEMFLKGDVPGTGVFGLFKKKTTRLQAETKGTGFEPKWSDEEKAAAAKSAPPGMKLDDATLDMYLRRKHGLPALPVQAPPDTETPSQPPADTAAPEYDTTLLNLP